MSIDLRPQTFKACIAIGKGQENASYLVQSLAWLMNDVDKTESRSLKRLVFNAATYSHDPAVIDLAFEKPLLPSRKPTGSRLWDSNLLIFTREAAPRLAALILNEVKAQTTHPDPTREESFLNLTLRDHVALAFAAAGWVRPTDGETSDLTVAYVSGLNAKDREDRISLVLAPLLTYLEEQDRLAA